MKYLLALVFSAVIFAQSDRGTITGTISDPAGAVVANAPVEARNTATGVVANVASSATGNYTIPALSAGSYEISVTVPGFKKYTRQGLTVQAAQTMRIDVILEVGNAAESVTVTEAAPLLKTESGELSHIVSTDRMNNMPGLQTSSASGSAGIRNPITVVALIPGSALTPGQTGPTVRINGGVNNSQTMLVEGMDASNSLGQGASQQNQVGVDSVQEFAIQTSNYAAEFGQAGSAIMNITMKSGTNNYHGSAYEYWTHEKLFAGQPLLNPINFPQLSDSNPRSKTRRNDYGFTIGGPVRIPKVYDGRNKTFFFFNWEQFRVGGNVIPDSISVPIADYRVGNFSKALGAQLGIDALGRPILANQIYDPLTRRSVTCQVGPTCTPGTSVDVSDPFLNNIIPQNRLDPVALKVQALLPNPENPSGLVNNFTGKYIQERVTGVPSFKIDHVVTSKHKFSFTFNRTRTQCDFCAGANGTALPISPAIGTDVRAHTERLNWDTTISPTMLLHWGIGWTQNWLGRPPLFDGYDATAELGLKGPFTGIKSTFPNFTGLSNTQSGGMANISSTPGSDDVFQQGTAIVSLTWVKNNHTYKFGGELRNQGDYALNDSARNGVYNFGPEQTTMPYLAAQNAGVVGSNPTGINYASFLLGLVRNGNVRSGSRARIGKQQWGFYVQDTWKVTRKMSLDYGLRYDYSTYLQESYGRMASFSPNVFNTRLGVAGGTAYEATCNCNFANNYKFGFGPRLGLAYQITPKTVLRAGFGVVYTGTPQYNLAGPALSAQNQFGPSGDIGREVMTLAGGMPLTPQQIAWPNLDPSYYPIASGNNLVGTGPNFTVDQNSGRPGRQLQWSIGLQREIFANLVVEASYIGNRQVWLTNAGLVNYNFISQDRLAANGLSLASAADRGILTAQITQPGAGRFQNRLPFAGFTGTVAQSLRPFPQFNGGLAAFWAPLGNAWYDAAQVKVTKRFSHGFDFTYNFTYSKEIDTLSIGNGGTTGPGDVTNRQNLKSLSANSRPFISGLGFNYTVQNYLGGQNKVVAAVARNWQIGSFLQYSSGLPFAPPAATTNPTMNNLTFQGTSMIRVPDQPLFTVPSLNCHCFDPNTTFVLNPAAWRNPAPGEFGSATYYGDFRRQRHPVETFSIGRLFRLREGVNLNVRGEWTNIFNRAYINDPTATNPFAAQNTQTVAGRATTQTSTGYGFINNATTNQGTFSTAGGAPRSGQIVARITF